MSAPASAPEPIAHFPQGRASPTEVDDIAAFMHKLTRRPLTVNRSLLDWVEELVVCRDDRGINAVHGFRFADVPEGTRIVRLVYAVFSLTTLTGKAKAQQAGQVGVRIYGRERKEHERQVIVWVNAPGCDPDLSFSTGALRPVRRLVPGTHSRLPQNMRFSTDEEGESAQSPVPEAIDIAVADLLREQRAREGEASLGRPTMRPTWKQLWAGFGVAATAAAAILLFPRHPQTTDEAALTANREKGGPTLRVFRQQGGGGEELISGSPVSPGDRVKFAVDLPQTQRIRVIGIEADGDLYQAWPAPGTKPADIVTAGRGWVLDGATVLDESRGRETLYLVSCPQELDTPICVSQGPGQPPLCPLKCTLSPFVLDKGSR